MNNPKRFKSLHEIADMLWTEMLKEIERNGNSDLTLNLEGAAGSIYNITEFMLDEQFREIRH